MRRPVALLLCLGLAACGGSGFNGSVQCAPYARSVTGLHLSGSAASWWRQSAGRYARTSRPAPGDVLVFRATRRLPSGHVSVVRRTMGTRAILVDQANWEPGRIDHGSLVVDVSPENDWTRVKVWWKPSHGLGRTAYPTFGFITPFAPDIS